MSELQFLRKLRIALSLKHGLLTGAVILTIIFDIEDTGATEFLMNLLPGRRMVRERQAFSPKEYTRKVQENRKQILEYIKKMEKVKAMPSPPGLMTLAPGLIKISIPDSSFSRKRRYGSCL